MKHLRHIVVALVVALAMVLSALPAAADSGGPQPLPPDYQCNITWE